MTVWWTSCCFILQYIYFKLERLITCGAFILGDLISTSKWMSYLILHASVSAKCEVQRGLPIPGLRVCILEIGKRSRLLLLGAVHAERL